MNSDTEQSGMLATWVVGGVKTLVYFSDRLFTCSMAWATP